MQIELSGHHQVVIADELRQRVQEKAEHLDRIFNGITTLHVAFHVEREQRIAEVVANVSHGAPVVAKVAAATLLDALEGAAEKIEVQLRRHKEKVRDHRVREARAEAPSPEEPEGEEGDSWETNPTTE